MRLVLSSGHGLKIRGASSQYGDEVDEAILVMNKTAEILRDMGHSVTTFTDTVSTSQSANLDRIVSFHNSQPAHDLDISIHFNCYNATAHGCEMLYTSSKGLELAKRMVDAVCEAGGFTNRGPKERNDLAFLNGTACTSCLAEMCFIDNNTDMNHLYRPNFDAICSALAGAIVGEEVELEPRPPRPPMPPQPPEPVPDEHPQLSEGSEGPAVVELQTVLGVPADGNFGHTTATQVEAFQRACGLTPDAIVGKNTWTAVDELEKKLADGGERLPPDISEAIVDLANASPLDDYEWPDRGMSPPGYVTGMSLCFAVALHDLLQDAAHANAMAQALGSSSVDALKWYESELKQQGCKLDTAEDRLRTLFVLMIGLSMRESSGRYPEGRDMSASNVEADTCEAGLMQTSWNIRSAHSSLPPLLVDYWDNPNGFRNEFAENVDPTAENLDVYGSGEGAKYQWLAKFCPLFAVLTSGVGLRTRKDHWGPIKRKEVTIRKDADALLRSVQDLIEGASV
jgi:hypothetical protein